ncbi:MAG: hypothetical protein CL917_14830 [Deltaproteobacteria bacterium]|nr:hypothetical protein [Deltaproteobacteria bacterium]
MNVSSQTPSKNPMAGTRRHRLFGLIRLLVPSLLFFVGCGLEVQMKHEPLLARSNDTVVFRAETEASEYLTSQVIRMYVDGSLVKTCSSSPCVYTGGPYAHLEDEWLMYHAEVEGQFEALAFTGSNVAVSVGATGISDIDRTWRAASGVTHVPARWGAHSSVTTNVLFQRSDDYNTTSAANGIALFADDLSTKINDILMDKEEIWGRMHDINIYAYRRSATTDSGCPGTPHSLTLSETGSFVDDNGILHIDNFTDCTDSFNLFSAEGSTNTQAFLHEFSHAIFELGDEYDGQTYYFEADDEPNIFDLENTCRVEQVTKGREPDDCYEFTTRQTGWWGTHTGTTVMKAGMKNDPWSLESVERLRWWFRNH